MIAFACRHQVKGFCTEERSWIVARPDRSLGDADLQGNGAERHFGVSLLVRRGGAMRPTSRGQRLLDMLPPLLAGIDSAKEILRQEEGALPAQLTLVTNLRVLVDEISRGMRTFQKARPRAPFAGI